MFFHFGYLWIYFRISDKVRISCSFVCLIAVFIVLNSFVLVDTDNCKKIILIKTEFEFFNYLFKMFSSIYVFMVGVVVGIDPEFCCWNTPRNVCRHRIFVSASMHALHGHRTGYFWSICIVGTTLILSRKLVHHLEHICLLCFSKLYRIIHILSILVCATNGNEHLFG